jgi:hypothetical protein
MGSDESYVSPYLLRPLRTLQEVLGGRSRAAESGSERVKSRQTRTGRDELRALADGNHRSAPRTTTE